MRVIGTRLGSGKLRFAAWGFWGRLGIEALLPIENRSFFYTQHSDEMLLLGPATRDSSLFTLWKSSYRMICRADNQVFWAYRTGMSSKQKIGRNGPCPCGSGKKYKKCCGAVHSRRGLYLALLMTLGGALFFMVTDSSAG